MKNTAIALLMILTCGVGLAAERGRIEIIGNGDAEALPEYARVQVTVTSICYESSREAKNANALLANKLVDVMKRFTSSPNDSVTAAGGPNVRQSEVVPSGDGSRIICEMKWRAVNLLTIQLGAIDSIPDLQDELLMAIDETAATVADPDAVAQTYADLSQPSFHVSDATMVKLRAEAQNKAFDDAKSQFDAFSERCSFQGVQLSVIKPPREQVFYHTRGRAMATIDTPIIPDKISINVSWQFVWTFTPASNCLVL